jgi:hypothetical protein
LTDANPPILSVVVAIASDTISPTDTRHLAPCLAALEAQTDSPPMEIIVPLPVGVVGIDSLRERFRDVRFFEYADLRKYSRQGRSREHHGELIARGFAQARGALIALIEDHDMPAPDWSANAVRAHQSAWAGVGGAIENSVDTPLNWAVYFSDFQLYQNPLQAGPSARASDACVIYKKSALEKIRALWEKEFHEASVNGALAECGEKLALDPHVVVYQRRKDLQLGTALEERFIWGRSFGAWRCLRAGLAQRLVWIVFSPILPFLLTVRRTRIALEKRRNLGAFLRALPLTFLLTVSWSCGELIGYITRRAVSSEIARAQALFARRGDAE